MLLQTYPMAEPILIGACITGTGGFAVWCAHTLVITRDKTERVCQALWGAPDGNGSDGLLALMHNQNGAMGTLSNENVEIRERLHDMERTCAMTHGTPK